VGKQYSNRTGLIILTLLLVAAPAMAAEALMEQDSINQMISSAALEAPGEEMDMIVVYKKDSTDDKTDGLLAMDTEYVKSLGVANSYAVTLTCCGSPSTPRCAHHSTSGWRRWASRECSRTSPISPVPV
jgi:hypothetical protein